MFNKTFVDDASTRRVVKSSCCFIFQEESLVDSLIDYDKCNLRLCSVLWIELADCLLELCDFDLDHCITLGITDTITEDHEVRWHALAFMLLFEGIDCKLQSLLELRVDYFLSTLLHEVLGVVLSHGRVSGR